MFKQFPKTRPALPAELARLHLAAYRANREGATTATSLARKMEGWLHRQVALDVLACPREFRTLEIGAGTLNQLAYEPVAGRYDIVEPVATFYAGSPQLGRIGTIFADVLEIPADQTYDRITSVATLEHLTNLPVVIAHAGLRLAPGGQFRAAIPSEGTPLWALGWRLTTGLDFWLRHGHDWGLLLRHEHVNTAREVEEVLRYLFRRVTCRVFGVSRWLSLYQFFACRDPDLDRCREFAVAGAATGPTACVTSPTGPSP